MVNSEDFTFTSDGKNIMKQIVSEQMKLAKKYRDIEGMGNILDTTNENLNTKEGQVWIKDFLSRASEEIAESYEAYDKEGYKIEHVIEELADSLHFLVEAAIIAGIHKNLPEPFHMDDKDFTDINFKTINEYYLDIFVHIGLTKNTLKNKKWKQTEVFTDKMRFEEHFNSAMMSLQKLFMMFDCGRKEMHEAYMKKHKVNEFRIKSQY